MADAVCLLGEDQDQCFLRTGKRSAEQTTVLRRLIIGACLTVLFMVGEMVAGKIANSVAIFSDAAHMLSDVFGFLISICAAAVVMRSAGASYSYGFHRLEVLGALASVLVIWVVTGVLVYEAAMRVVHPEPVNGKIMFIVGLAGVAFNGLVMATLGVHGHLGGKCDHGHGHGACGGHAHGRGDSHGHSHVHSHDPHDEAHSDCDGHLHGHSHEQEHAHAHAHSGCGGHSHPHGAGRADQRGGGCGDHGHSQSHEHGDSGGCSHGHDQGRSLAQGSDSGSHCGETGHDCGHGQGHTRSHSHSHSHSHGLSRGHGHGRVPPNPAAGAGGAALMIAAGVPSCGVSGHLQGCNCTIRRVGEQGIEVCVQLPVEALSPPPDGIGRPASRAPRARGHARAHGHGARHNINLRSAAVHVLGDAVQSIGVAVAGGVIWAKQHDPRWALVDPIVTFVFAVLVLLTTRIILVDIYDTLMERAPGAINASLVSDAIAAVAGVSRVHDFHVWQVSVGLPVLTAHVHLEDSADASLVLGRLQSYLRGIGITHSTIQVCNPMPAPAPAAAAASPGLCERCGAEAAAEAEAAADGKAKAA